MKFPVAALLLVITFTTSRGAEPSPAPALPTIEVTVLDAVTNQPIPGATVRSGREYPGPPPVECATDKSGFCKLTLGAAHSSLATLNVSLPSYLPQTIWWYPADPDFQFPKTITVKLDKGVTIGGTVVDESGLPIPDAMVEVSMTNGFRTDPKQSADSVYTRDLRTDAVGKWTFQGAYPARYRPILWIYAKHEGFQSDDSWRQGRSQHEPPLDPAPFYDQTARTFLRHPYTQDVRQALPTARTEDTFLMNHPGPTLPVSTVTSPVPH